MARYNASVDLDGLSRLHDGGDDGRVASLRAHLRCTIDALRGDPSQLPRLLSRVGDMMASKGCSEVVAGHAADLLCDISTALLQVVLTRPEEAWARALLAGVWVWMCGSPGARAGGATVLPRVLREGGEWDPSFEAAVVTVEHGQGLMACVALFARSVKQPRESAIGLFLWGSAASMTRSVATCAEESLVEMSLTLQGCEKAVERARLLETSSVMCSFLLSSWRAAKSVSVASGGGKAPGSVRWMGKRFARACSAAASRMISPVLHILPQFCESDALIERLPARRAHHDMVLFVESCLLELPEDKFLMQLFAASPALVRLAGCATGPCVLVGDSVVGVLARLAEGLEARFDRAESQGLAWDVLLQLHRRLRSILSGGEGGRAVRHRLRVRLAQLALSLGAGAARAPPRVRSRMAEACVELLSHHEQAIIPGADLRLLEGVCRGGGGLAPETLVSLAAVAQSLMLSSGERSFAGARSWLACMMRIASGGRGGETLDSFEISGVWLRQARLHRKRSDGVRRERSRAGDGGQGRAARGLVHEMVWQATGFFLGFQRDGLTINWPDLITELKRRGGEALDSCGDAKGVGDDKLNLDKLQEQLRGVDEAVASARERLADMSRETMHRRHAARLVSAPARGEAGEQPRDSECALEALAKGYHAVQRLPKEQRDRVGRIVADVVHVLVAALGGGYRRAVWEAGETSCRIVADALGCGAREARSPVSVLAPETLQFLHNVGVTDADLNGAAVDSARAAPPALRPVRPVVKPPRLPPGPSRRPWRVLTEAS
jgi:hypothetical protein